MTDVRAGSHQRSIASGDYGIVTLWVRAKSNEIALAEARFILTSRRYASIGELHAYAETLADNPLACSTDEELAAERRDDWLLAGYEALKTHALAQADGLHEVWLGAAHPEVARHSKFASG
jgi:hypothetical protein